MEDKKSIGDNMSIMGMFDDFIVGSGSETANTDSETENLFRSIDGVSDIPSDDKDRSFRLFENWYKDHNVQIDDINTEIRKITNPDDSESRLCDATKNDDFPSDQQLEGADWVSRKIFESIKNFKYPENIWVLNRFIPVKVSSKICPLIETGQTLFTAYTRSIKLTARLSDGTEKEFLPIKYVAAITYRGCEVDWDLVKAWVISFYSARVRTWKRHYMDCYAGSTNFGHCEYLGTVDVDHIEDLMVEYTDMPLKARKYEQAVDTVVSLDSDIPSDYAESPYDVMPQLAKLAVDLRSPYAIVYDKMSYLMWMIKYDSYDDMLPEVIGDCNLMEYEWDLLINSDGSSRFKF